MLKPTFMGTNHCLMLLKSTAKLFNKKAIDLLSYSSNSTLYTIKSDTSLLITRLDEFLGFGVLDALFKRSQHVPGMLNLIGTL